MTQAIYHEMDFPFEEIRGENDDYFSSVSEATSLGYRLSQVWSVVEEDNIFVYGPAHHYINVLGYICTEEHHDDHTYYEVNLQWEAEQNAKS
jgi:hypothetical protein